MAEAEASFLMARTNRECDGAEVIAVPGRTKRLSRAAS
jgi:hypothetical protein